MSEALTIAEFQASLPPIPWRDPSTVSPGGLRDYIAHLEQACTVQPQSAELRTCLGMAYAVNFEVYKSFDALEAAVALDPHNFWSQLKYAELHYRLRLLPRAEEETRKSLELARNHWQLAIARRQLQDIRRLLHAGTRTVTWTKSLLVPSLTVAAMIAAVFVGYLV